jgi:hypothetical protein
LRSGLPCRAWLLPGFHAIAARATEDEQPGVNSHPRNPADELHRPTALPARWSVVVVGRRGLRMDRIAFALLLREALEELAERLFARKFGR